MNFNKVINKKKRNLTHGSHGGEIYKLNSRNNPNSLIDFSTNINPLVTPNIFAKMYMNSINQVSKYPDSNSTLLKKELVIYFDNKVNKENLIIGAGSIELISIFCDMFIDPGDEIIIAQPTFSEYAWAVQKNGGTIINVYRKPENHFRVECKPIIDQITPKTKVIFLCNPNNPNGLLDHPKDIEKIINIASKNDVLVFLDEAFIEFTREFNSFIYRLSSHDNLFISRSFTKFFGLTGLRIGFGVSTPEIIDYITPGQNLWSVNCFGQIIAQEMLKSEKFIEDSLNFFSKERVFMKNELKKIPGVKIFPTDTNFFLINTENSQIKSNKIKELLLKENILVRDCSNYDGLNDYYLRISIKDRDLNIKLINSLKKIILSQK
ncbi:MAG: pyridoxal phosphate-dependent aminotransferase [Candidatus Odinarchaeota archaeon]